MSPSDQVSPGASLLDPEVPETHLDLAETIAARYPADALRDIPRMIADRTISAGLILVGLVLFWFWFVHSADDGSTQGRLLSINFEHIAALVPLVVAFGAIFASITQLLGRPHIGLLSGLLYGLAIYLTIDPFARFLVGGVSFQNALWQTSRLLVLGGGVHVVVRFGIDAFQLRWLKLLSERFNLELISAEVEADAPDASA